MTEHELTQIGMMKQLVTLAEKQTDYSARRSEMSEVRSYHNAERTLSVWVRTALSLMICGLAIDRFGLMLGGNAGTTADLTMARALLLDRMSEGTSLALIVLGVIMVVTTGLRFLAYARGWRKLHELPACHGPYLAPFFAMAVGLFGGVLLLVMASAMV